MSIRSTAKAIIINNDKVLLNKCYDEHNGEYYSLPGGGQNTYETLHEAVIDAQIGSEWINIEALNKIHLMPIVLNNNISKIIEEEIPLFLGSEHIKYNHG